MKTREDKRRQKKAKEGKRRQEKAREGKRRENKIDIHIHVINYATFAPQKKNMKCHES